jgi:3-oxoacyl-[acyl-carrier-protein] synthase-3
LDVLAGLKGYFKQMLTSNQEWRNAVWLLVLKPYQELSINMIEIHDYSDGAGASVIEASDETGLLSYESSTYAMDEANYFFGKSYNPESDPDTRYIKNAWP